MRSKKKYLIDGRFLNSMTTGIDRYAYQLLECLDKICKGLDIATLFLFFLPPDNFTVKAV